MRPGTLGATGADPGCTVAGGGDSTGRAGRSYRDTREAFIVLLMGLKCPQSEN